MTHDATAASTVNPFRLPGVIRRDLSQRQRRRRRRRHEPDRRAFGRRLASRSRAAAPWAPRTHGVGTNFLATPSSTVWGKYNTETKYIHHQSGKKSNEIETLRSFSAGPRAGVENFQLSFGRFQIH
jgi:hypothetical protein